MWRVDCAMMDHEAQGTPIVVFVCQNTNAAPTLPWANVKSFLDARSAILWWGALRDAPDPDKPLCFVVDVDLIHSIRLIETLRDDPRVFCVGLVSAGDFARATQLRDMGIHYLCWKPFDARQLEYTIHVCLTDPSHKQGPVVGIYMADSDERSKLFRTLRHEKIEAVLLESHRGDVSPHIKTLAQSAQSVVTVLDSATPKVVELVRRMKSGQIARVHAIVLCTLSNSSTDLIHELLNAGADDIVFLPAEDKDLLRRIRAIHAHAATVQSKARCLRWDPTNLDFDGTKESYEREEKENESEFVVLTLAPQLDAARPVGDDLLPTVAHASPLLSKVPTLVEKIRVEVARDVRRTLHGPVVCRTIVHEDRFVVQPIPVPPDERVASYMFVCVVGIRASDTDTILVPEQHVPKMRALFSAIRSVLRGDGTAAAGAQDCTRVSEPTSDNMMRVHPNTVARMLESRRRVGRVMEHGMVDLAQEVRDLRKRVLDMESDRERMFKMEGRVATMETAIKNIRRVAASQGLIIPMYSIAPYRGFHLSNTETIGEKQIRSHVQSPTQTPNEVFKTIFRDLFGLPDVLYGNVAAILQGLREQTVSPEFVDRLLYLYRNTVHALPFEERCWRAMATASAEESTQSSGKWSGVEGRGVIRERDLNRFVRQVVRITPSLKVVQHHPKYYTFVVESIFFFFRSNHVGRNITRHEFAVSNFPRLLKELHHGSEPQQFILFATDTFFHVESGYNVFTAVRSNRQRAKSFGCSPSVLAAVEANVTPSRDNGSASSFSDSKCDEKQAFDTSPTDSSDDSRDSTDRRRRRYSFGSYVQLHWAREHPDQPSAIRFWHRLLDKNQDGYLCEDDLLYHYTAKYYGEDNDTEQVPFAETSSVPIAKRRRRHDGVDRAIQQQNANQRHIGKMVKTWPATWKAVLDRLGKAKDAHVQISARDVIKSNAGTFLFDEFVRGDTITAEAL